MVTPDTASSPWIDVDAVLELLLAAPAPGTGRRLVAIAGAPGSGKSTLAESLADRLNERRPGLAALLPMDGYHFDDIVLDQLGRKAHKGAPDTFDVDGFDHMLARLRARDEAVVAVPVFDRSIEIARAGARLIPQSVDLIVVEGNYLLLDALPWRKLRRHFDLSLFVDVPEAVLRDRLIRRWQSYDLPPDVVTTKVEENDLPNARAVIAGSAAPDYRVNGA